MAFRLYQHRRRLLQAPKETPLGFKLIGNPSMEAGTFETTEVAFVRQILDHTDVFINIGANIGYYCCLALLQDKHTVAFEPMEENLGYLYRNLAANHWEDKAEVFPIALSSRVGLLEMFGGGTGASLIRGWAGASDKYTRTVPVSTLDTVLGARFNGKRCFLLVDVEGAEKEMLEGARQMLASEPKPIWMVEITIRESQPEGIRVNPHLQSVFELFWKNGYEAWTVGSRFQRVDCDEVKKVAATGENTLDTHNFLFMEAEQKEAIFGESTNRRIEAMR